MHPYGICTHDMTLTLLIDCHLILWGWSLWYNLSLNMLRKPGLLPSCYSLQSHLYPHHLSSTSPSNPRKRARRSPNPNSKRSYAEVHNRGPDFRDNMNWPTKSKTSTSITPTPYEIFDIDRGAAYSKHKFYELVKIYHPDRHTAPENACCQDISHLERLERYRLVILANEILSDPIKRQNYDKHGEGWADHQRIINRHTHGYCAKGSRTPYGRGKGYDNSPFANATWEDWERWYARDTNEPVKQSSAGNYINPNIFASLILMMAVISGAVQATRAGQYSGSLEERAQDFTEKTSRFLRKRADTHRIESVDSGDRVKWFLDKRDPSKNGLKDVEEDIYKGHFPDQLLPPPKLPPEKKLKVSDTAK
jgi:curved DNA-binding protein CbpA